MAPLARPATVSAVLLALLAPLWARADALALTHYEVAPVTIYPSATSSPALATSTAITFGFSERAKVSLMVLGPSGESIRTLYASSGVTNPEPKLWDGTDAAGAVVAPGTYTLALAATSTAQESDALYDTSKTVAVALPPQEPPPDFTPEEYALPLARGWNLLSLPVVPDDPGAAQVFASPAIDSVWSYDLADPAAVGGWLVFDPAHPELSTLAATAPGAGYFVRARAEAQLSGNGTPYLAPGRTPPSRALAAGWNLIGSYATSTADLDDAFASIGWAGIEYTALYSFLPGSESFGLPSAVAPGAAFWIYTPAPENYVPSDL
ncbi:MAG TPA: hypothetical protein VHC68_00015 [Candidatus Paceibacterota bacterium]|nr:hypothetical protein [Candidatus Paceibacterota bacterium]